MSVLTDLIEAKEKLEVGKATLEIMRGPAWRIVHAAAEKDRQKKLAKLASYATADMLAAARIQGELAELARFLWSEERLLLEIKTLAEQIKQLEHDKQAEASGASGFGGQFIVNDAPDGNPLKGLVPT